MPLNESNSESKSTRTSFLDQRQKERSQFDPISRSHTPLNTAGEVRKRRSSGSTTDGDVTNPLGAKDVVPTRKEKHQKAIAMKMQVPDAFGSRTTITGKKPPDVAPTEDFVTARTYNKPQITMQRELHTNFDDTMSLPFDDESSLQDNENRTMVFRGGPMQSLRIPPTRSQNEQRYNSAFDSTTPLQDFNIDIPHDWQEQVQAERNFQEQQRRSGKQGVPLQGISQIEHPEDDDGRTDTGTQSRRQNLPPRPFARSAPPTKMVSFNSPGNKDRKPTRADSPELEIHKKTKDSKSDAGSENSRQPISTVEAANSHEASNVSQYVNEDSAPKAFLASLGRSRDAIQRSHMDNIESSRASDYPTSSEDEFPTIHPESPILQVTQEGQVPRKRKRDQEIDFDVNTLRTMTYNELQSQNFGTDPRNLTKGGFDSQGNTMTLSQRLVNLDRMTDEEQKIMFRNQSDEEWTQMGSWFIDQFQEGLKRLIEARTERRKTSLRFEDEIRRRQKSIEWSSAGLEEELKDLKRGGGELIRGRDVSRIGTPQKSKVQF